jgi:hypothetical protein
MPGDYFNTLLGDFLLDFRLLGEIDGSKLGTCWSKSLSWECDGTSGALEVSGFLVVFPLKTFSSVPSITPLALYYLPVLRS